MRNLEIKIPVRDFHRILRRVTRVLGRPPARVDQRDTFFHVPRGRLKLRETTSGNHELIYYLRPDQEGGRVSCYETATVAEPAPLKRLLAQALGVRGVVCKRRFIGLLPGVRIHLDEVQNLGTFLEIEIQLADGETAAEARPRLEALLAQLGVEEEQGIAPAYIDLLENAESDAGESSGT